MKMNWFSGHWFRRDRRCGFICLEVERTIQGWRTLWQLLIFWRWWRFRYTFVYIVSCLFTMLIWYFLQIMRLISHVGQMVGSAREQGGGTNRAQVLDLSWAKGQIQHAHFSRSTLKEMRIGLISWLTNRLLEGNNY